MSKSEISSSTENRHDRLVVAVVRTCSRTRHSAKFQQSASPVAQVSKPAAGEPAGGPSAKRPCTESQSKNIAPIKHLPIPPLNERTAPTPTLGVFAKTGCHRILSDIPSDAAPLRVAANPVIKALALPESPCSNTENFLGLTGGELFPRLQDVAQEMIWHRPENDVNVVGHDNPFVQHLPVFVKMEHGIANDPGDLGPAQMTCAMPLVEKPFDLSLKFTDRFFLGSSTVCFGDRFERSQSRGVFALKLKQDLFRQGIRQSKRCKVGASIPFDVRQIAAGVNSRSQRIRCFNRSTGHPKFVARSIQSGILSSVRRNCHDRSLAMEGNASKFVVRNIVEYRRTGDLRGSLNYGVPADLEIGDTAGLETCATILP
jgi:hypothetical protein